MNVSKRILGVSYLVGTGLALSLALAGRLLLRGVPDPTTAVATLSGLCLSGSLLAVGSWVLYSDLDEDEAWLVAQYGGLGLALLTLPVVLSIVFRDPSADRLVIPLASNVAAGGLVGAVEGVAGMRIHGTDRPRGPDPAVDDPSTGEVRSLLDHPRRRVVAAALVDAPVPVAVTDLALHVAREEDGADRDVIPPAACHDVYESLLDDHVPRLAEADLVRYDADRGYVEPTERIGLAVPYLDAGRAAGATRTTGPGPRS